MFDLNLYILFQSEHVVFIFHVADFLCGLLSKLGLCLLKESLKFNEHQPNVSLINFNSRTFYSFLNICLKSQSRPPGSRSPVFGTLCTLSTPPSPLFLGLLVPCQRLQVPCFWDSLYLVNEFQHLESLLFNNCKNLKKTVYTFFLNVLKSKLMNPIKGSLNNLNLVSPGSRGW